MPVTVDRMIRTKFHLLLIKFDIFFLEGNFPPIGAISGVFVLPGISSLPVLDVLGPIPV